MTISSRNPNPRRTRRRRGLQLDRSGPWIGAGGVFVNLWLTISSTLYAPWWGIVLLLSYLAPQVVLVRRWATSRPVRCAVVPVVGAVAWALTVLVGATWWGWRM